MNRERFVLHLNVVDFAVAVERVVDRSLCGRPVIVAPLRANRAIVHDMSEEAYGDGVRKGMLLQEASRLCRSARLLPPRFDLYKKAMGAFVREAREYSPILEPGIGDGHLFLDITGTHRLFGTAPDVGWQLRKQVRRNLRIDPIWSVGTNKLVAKVASRVVKPAGEYIVSPGEEERFFAPLLLVLLPGLQVREKRRLLEFNIKWIGQLAALGEKQLHTVFGRRAEVLYNISRGKDDRRVSPPGSKQPVISREHVIAGDSDDLKMIKGVFVALTVRVGLVLRTSGMAGRRLLLRLNYIDGSSVTRQISFHRGVSDDFTMQSAMFTLLKRAWGRRTRVRSCRLSCERLHRKSPQLSLFPNRTALEPDKEQLLSAIDQVRNKFGADSVRFGSQTILH